MRNGVGDSRAWLSDASLSLEYSIITTPDDKVKVALLGLLSDEPDVFYGGTFKGAPIDDVLETYTKMYNSLIPSGTADFILPLTHQSLKRDVQLAQHMLHTTNISQGLIVGGHDHVIMDEIVFDETNTSKSVRILKSGMDLCPCQLD